MVFLRVKLLLTNVQTTPVDSIDTNKAQVDSTKTTYIIQETNISHLFDQSSILRGVLPDRSTSIQEDILGFLVWHGFTAIKLKTCKFCMKADDSAVEATSLQFHPVASGWWDLCHFLNCLQQAYSRSDFDN